MLGCLAHWPILERTPEAVADQGINHLLIAILVPRARSRKQVGRLAHAFHAAGDDDLGFAGADRLGCEHDRLQAGAADFVHGVRGYGIGQPSEQCRLAGRVLADAGLHDVAHDDFVHCT